MGDSCKVFVGNLSYDATEDELYEIFGNCGKVEDVAIITDRDTGRARGFGFVTFSSPDEAEAAIKRLHQTDFKGRDLTVREAESRRGGGGGGGGYRGRGGGYGGGRGGGGGYGGGRSGGGYGGGGGGNYDGGRYDNY
ncbi:putative RNA-binding protein RbpB isoform X4 [Clavelina lepadiformis]|uniref:putative RNA-binding protein RbpB isoform X4 n=1 Tax=Clavelina lepadiformis TaxID=159417 RepID=UPI00404179EF